jgi:hypothetical protein
MATWPFWIVLEWIWSVLALVQVLVKWQVRIFAFVFVPFVVRLFLELGFLFSVLPLNF